MVKPYQVGRALSRVAGGKWTATKTAKGRSFFVCECGCGASPHPGMVSRLTGMFHLKWRGRILLIDSHLIYL